MLRTRIVGHLSYVQYVYAAAYGREPVVRLLIAGAKLYMLSSGISFTVGHQFESRQSDKPFFISFCTHHD